VPASEPVLNACVCSRVRVHSLAATATTATTSATRSALFFFPLVRAGACVCTPPAHPPAHARTIPLHSSRPHGTCAWRRVRAQALHVLLQNGANADVPRGGDGFTPLMVAAKQQQAALAEMLIRAKADVAKCAVGDRNAGATALHVASDAGCYEIVDMLCYHPRNPLNARRDIDKGTGESRQAQPLGARTRARVRAVL
jgi:ankyrin repeat protein